MFHAGFRLYGDMDIQEQYWAYMYQLRFNIFYLDLYAEDASKKDRAIKFISAVGASGGIAAWAVWQDLMPVWTAIIALSQVISAVKEHLPYSTRLKNIEASQKSLKLLYSKMEYTWFQVQSGKLSEAQINEVLYEFKKEYIEIESQSLKKDVLMPNKRRSKKAKEQTEEYVHTYFGHQIPGGSHIPVN